MEADEPWRALFGTLSVLALDGPDAHAAVAAELNRAVVLGGGLPAVAAIGSALARDDQVAGFAEAAMARHTHLGPALVSLLDRVKERRFFPQSNHLWLKRINRGCWYIVASHGMPSPYAEALAPYRAHEKESTGKPFHIDELRSVAIDLKSLSHKKDMPHPEPRRRQWALPPLSPLPMPTTEAQAEAGEPSQVSIPKL
jgi:hypothetical protein